MNCPFCNKRISRFTGLMEARMFQKHLGKCKKNPDNLVVWDGTGMLAVVIPRRAPTLQDALELRAKSLQ